MLYVFHFLYLLSLIHICIISIQDRIDTFDELFPDTKPSQVIRMFGSLSEECAVLRKASAHIIHLQQNIRPPKKSERALSKLEREKNIVNMYLSLIHIYV